MVNNSVKVCSKCNIEKNICLYSTRINRNNTSTVYYQSRCKDCRAKDSSNYAANNKEKRSETRKKYYLDNKQRENSNSKTYYSRNRNVIIKRSVKYIAQRLKTDMVFKLKYNISRAIRDSLTERLSSKNNLSVWKYLPFSKLELKNHIESKFESWMTWNNWGVYRVDSWNDHDQSTWTWQIDHIIPQMYFKYTSMRDEGFIKCWALDNLRPYSAKKNLEENYRKIL